MDARTSDPASCLRWRSCLLLHMVPGRNRHRHARWGRGSSPGNRGQLRDRQERARARPRRDPLPAWPAPPRLAGHARLRHDGHHPPSRQCSTAPKNNAPDKAQGQPLIQPLIRWSVQEIRRIATRLAQRQIHPAHVIAWSLWRRAHQAQAQEAHIKSRMQL